MPLNQKQHHYLDAMGINLWQQKKQAETGNLNIPVSSQKIEYMDIEHLSQSQFFKDIIRAMDISLGDISVEKNVLNLGWLNWEINQEGGISFTKNTLRTPEISKILQSKTMKSVLWTLLSQQT